MKNELILKYEGKNVLRKTPTKRVEAHIPASNWINWKNWHSNE